MMRVVVVGATGNVGSSLLRVLAGAGEINLTAVARRLPAPAVRKRLGADDWAAADIAHDDFVPLFRGADVVVHLAWLIQPSRNRAELRRVNVGGSERLFRAVVAAGVGSLVYASSVGAYAVGPPSGERVDESWPTDGIAPSYYSLQKAAVEQKLDRLEREQPKLRVVRMRPALVFKHEAATGVRRLFAGPFLPGFVLPRLPLAPAIDGLRFQCVHSDDVARAFAAAVLGEARGAFNIAAEPVLESEVPAQLLGARPVRVPAQLARMAASAAWRTRLTSVSPDWLELGLGAPLLDCGRARHVLEWSPRVSADDALRELLDGLSRNADGPTPPLARETSGFARWREIASRLGGREDVAARSGSS